MPASLLDPQRDDTVAPWSTAALGHSLMRYVNMQVNVTTPNSTSPTNSTGVPGGQSNGSSAWAAQERVQTLCMVTFQTSLIAMMSSYAMSRMPDQLRGQPIVDTVPYHIARASTYLAFYVAIFSAVWLVIGHICSVIAMIGIAPGY